MSFKHRFPTSVTAIGYLEGASRISNTKNSGQKITAKLYNPSEHTRKYDLRVPIIALGKAASIVDELARSGDLVAVVGRLAMVQSGGGLSISMLVDYIKTLDEGEIVDAMDEYC